MAIRQVVAYDNESLKVAINSPWGWGRPRPGSPIINNSDSPNGTIYDFSGAVGKVVTLDDTRQIDVFNDDMPNQHRITDGNGLVANGARVESESLIVLREYDPVTGQPVGQTIEINVYSQGGRTSDIWGFSETGKLQPGKQYIKVGGSNNGDSNYANIAPCFTPGALIRTDDGPAPVEEIVAGTRVWTQGDGFQPVLWAGATLVDGRGRAAPVEFAPGVLGNARALAVSPSHRMVHVSARAELAFGHAQVLIPAKFFLGRPGVRRRPARAVAYHHFMFDRHQIVEAEGCLSESFYPGAMALSGLEAQTRDELIRLFPELAARPEAPMELAGFCARAHEARVALGSDLRLSA